MGIKGLWSVLTPFSEKKSLHEVRGETIAIDLSGWVCDSQNVTDYYIQPKLYLRNLFFRTIYLLLADITPVFVLEGDAPELKRDVMASRNAIQFRGAAPRPETAASKKPDVARKRFKGVQRECENLLKCMGVICVKGKGEAEATCAQLNAQGLVNAVVSQDSDCFAYGARVVYRNFSVSSAGGGGAMAGSVDAYDADKMFQSNGFGRYKMVALAILCGCDYGVGACGSSINTVVSFLHTVPEKEAISRLLSWVIEPEHYEERARWLAVPGRCDKCGHSGRNHAKNGCPVCVTHKGCTDNGHKTKMSEVKRELSLRSRALSCGVPFPEPKVMNEFLHNEPEEIHLDSLTRPAPNLIQFVKLMKSKLDWSERYCVQKFLPLLTKSHLQDRVASRTIKPITIKKKRNPRGVPSYEVVWSDIDGEYEGLISDEQFEDGEDIQTTWTTTERQDLMRKYYPDIVETFEESIKKPVKEKQTRNKKNPKSDINKPKRKYTKKIKPFDVDVDNLSTSMRNVNISKTKDLNCSKANVSISVNKLKRKLKGKTKGQKTIDSFIANKRRKSDRKVKEPSIHKSFNINSVSINNDLLFEYNNCDDYLYNYYNEDRENKLTNDDKKNHLLSMLNSTVEDVNESDLSDIVDKIVTTAPTIKTAKVNSQLYKLVFDKYSTPKKVNRNCVLKEIHNYCSTPKESPLRRKSVGFMNIICNNSFTSKANTSYFFDKLTEDCDAFELSLDYKNKCDIINLDCDTTVEYSLPEVQTVDHSLPEVQTVEYTSSLPEVQSVDRSIPKVQTFDHSLADVQSVDYSLPEVQL